MLSQCLFLIAQASAKRMPYKESKLTRSIQNCLTSQSTVMLIANLNSDEKFYDECLSTLQFVEKTRSLDMRGKLSDARTCIDTTIKVKIFKDNIT